MVLSKPKDKLYDPFRKKWTSATPEEIVRQKLLYWMTEKLGFPSEYLSVEKQLSELPHLFSELNLPVRRADILCFAKDIHPEFPLFPLLLIECKEGLISKKAIDQALGYNHYVKAPYVAMAGKEGVQLVYPQRLSFLPRYTELLEQLWQK